MYLEQSSYSDESGCNIVSFLNFPFKQIFRKHPFQINILTNNKAFYIIIIIIINIIIIIIITGIICIIK